VRVLICDDEPDIRLLYRIAFEREGAEVDEASSGAECLAVADANEPDIIVLDLLMPGRDGLASLVELRREHPRSRVLIVSAHAAVDVFEASRSRGATACFDKIGFLPRIPWVVQRFGAPLEKGT
jgi:DNA-binding response OmpR family regulator